MTRFLYFFAYQTPDQKPPTPGDDPPDESLAALFIEADSAEQALAWGREVSEAFVRCLFKNPKLSWRTLQFDHWIETPPHEDFLEDTLTELPIVSQGAMPDFDRLK